MSRTACFIARMDWPARSCWHRARVRRGGDDGQGTPASALPRQARQGGKAANLACVAVPWSKNVVQGFWGGLQLERCTRRFYSSCCIVFTFVRALFRARPTNFLARHFKFYAVFLFSKHPVLNSVVASKSIPPTCPSRKQARARLPSDREPYRLRTCGLRAFPSRPPLQRAPSKDLPAPLVP